MHFKKIFSILICMALLLSTMTYAVTVSDTSEVKTETVVQPTVKAAEGSGVCGGDLRWEISFLILEYELLFRPSTSCRGACLNIKFTGNPALKFQCHYFSAGTYLPTLRTSTSKMSVEFGSIPRLPLEPYASSAGI